jgi:hypothetical protein
MVHAVIIKNPTTSATAFTGHCNSQIAESAVLKRMTTYSWTLPRDGHSVYLINEMGNIPRANRLLNQHSFISAHKELSKLMPCSDVSARFGEVTLTNNTLNQGPAGRTGIAGEGGACHRGPEWVWAGTCLYGPGRSITHKQTKS